MIDFIMQLLHLKMTHSSDIKTCNRRQLPSKWSKILRGKLITSESNSQRSSNTKSRKLILMTVQNCGISIANTLEIPQSCTKPLISNEKWDYLLFHANAIPVNTLAPGRFQFNFRDVIFTLILSEWWLVYLLWNCPQMNATRLYWW